MKRVSPFDLAEYVSASREEANALRARLSVLKRAEERHKKYKTKHMSNKQVFWLVESNYGFKGPFERVVIFETRKEAVKLLSDRWMFPKGSARICRLVRG